MIQPRVVSPSDAIGFVHGEEGEHMGGIGSDRVELVLNVGIGKVRSKKHQFHSQGHGLVCGSPRTRAHGEVDKAALFNDRPTRRD